MPSWQITNDNLTQLDQLKETEKGELRLTATGLEPAAADAVVAAIKKFGNRFSAIRFEPKWRLERWDFSKFDFAKKCPGLEELRLGRCLVHPSVFAHPALTELELRESKVEGPKEITISGPLGWITIGDSFTASQMVFGPQSKIRSISWSIDEDCSDATPDEFVCDGCQELRSIDIHACGSWTLDLRGKLPALTSTSFDATQYCRYELRTKGLKPGSSSEALAIKPGSFGGDESEE